MSSILLQTCSKQ